MPAKQRVARTAKSRAVARPKAGAANRLGSLPEWNLADLYSGIDDPNVKRDLDRADAECIAFEEAFKGKLAALAERSDAGPLLAEAVKRYEGLDDLLGRLISFAGLVHAGNTVDPARAKFYGDVQERITAASTHLLFFVLELNRIDDAHARSRDGAIRALGHYRPWLEDIRKEKPYQLEDRIEQLFHEKSVTGLSAWNRLFDETIAALRFKVGGEVARDRADAQPAAGPEREDAQGGGAGARQDVQGATCRIFALITNTLAKDKEISDRWRGFADVADARHLVQPRRARGGRGAGRGGARRLSAAVASLLRAEGASGSARSSSTHWDRNAPLPKVADAARSAGTRRRRRCSPPMARSRREMAAIAERFFENNWIDAPVRPGKAPGAFAHPTVPSAHPYVLLNYQGKPRDVMTLAHELGHGVHQVLAAPNGALMAPTPLTLAETASVFGEMLTFRKLLAQRPTTSSARPCSPPRSRT